MVEVVGFIVLAVLFTGYLLLDGYDLGIGAISPFVARDEGERVALHAAIGPFWNGNEVWLIAAGGTLFGLFPEAYAVSFSGFYLPFIIALWLLMLRGISIELRDTVESPLWREFWDVVFAFSSGLLAVVLGIALGNLIRGVELNHGGYFFGSFAVLLNPFALGTGVLALVALAVHGLVYAAMRIEGPFGVRCGELARKLWPLLAALFVIMTAAAYAIYHGADVHPVLSGIITVAALAALAWLRLPNARPAQTYYASSAFVTLLMVAAAATLFPYLVPNYPRGTGGLSIYNAGAPPPGPFIAFIGIVILALVALLGYRAYVAARVTRPVHVDEPRGYA